MPCLYSVSLRHLSPAPIWMCHCAAPLFTKPQTTIWTCQSATPLFRKTQTSMFSPPPPLHGHVTVLHLYSVSLRHLCPAPYGHATVLHLYSVSFKHLSPAPIWTCHCDVPLFSKPQTSMSSPHINVPLCCAFIQ